jgi:hypothetical protein
LRATGTARSSLSHQRQRRNRSGEFGRREGPGESGPRGVFDGLDGSCCNTGGAGINATGTVATDVAGVGIGVTEVSTGVL